MADPVDTSQDDYLQSVLQGQPGPDDSAPPPQAAAVTPAQDPTQVSGITANAPPAAQQGVNYQGANLAASANNARAALASPAFTPQGGGVNPGVWGLLPQNMQHGTLRNVLGALGDAFLVGSGHQAQYEPRMERQQEGLAMAAYPENPELAAGLVGATGTPGSAQLEDNMVKNTQQANLAKQVQQQNNQYQQQRIADTQANNASLASSRVSQRVQAIIPQVTGFLNQATDQADYARRYAVAKARAKQFGQDKDGNDLVDPTTDFNAVEPQFWRPGMQQGLTSGQQQISTDKGAQRQQTGADVAATNQARIQAAGVSSKLPTEASQINSIREAVNSGKTLSPGDQAIWDKHNYIPKKTSLNIPGLTAPSNGQPSKAAPNAGQPQTATGKNGEKYTLQNGQWVRTH